jgi:FMN phosphatase YigB (HAD superfamily)
LTNLPYDLFTLKHNPDKTDPEYFYKMLAHFNLTTEDTVYFEHNPKAVESAKSIGIDCYQYDPNQKDIQALKTFLDSKLTN